jgi:hypothetical protein
VAEVFRAGRRNEVIALGPKIVDRSGDFAIGAWVDAGGIGAVVEVRPGVGFAAGVGAETGVGVETAAGAGA